MLHIWIFLKRLRVYVNKYFSTGYILIVTYYSILWMCQFSTSSLLLQIFASKVTQSTGSKTAERKATSQSVYETGLTLKYMILTK